MSRLSRYSYSEFSFVNVSTNTLQFLSGLLYFAILLTRCKCKFCMTTPRQLNCYSHENPVINHLNTKMFSCISLSVWTVSCYVCWLHYIKFPTFCPFHFWASSGDWCTTEDTIQSTTSRLYCLKISVYWCFVFFFYWKKYS